MKFGWVTKVEDLRTRDKAQKVSFRPKEQVIDEVTQFITKYEKDNYTVYNSYVSPYSEVDVVDRLQIRLPLKNNIEETLKELSEFDLVILKANTESIIVDLHQKDFDSISSIFNLAKRC